MKKSLYNIESKVDSTSYDDFNDYQLKISLGFLRLIIICMGVLNIVLLITDFINYSNDQVSLIAIILRVIYIFMVSILLIFYGKIKTYNLLTIVITIYELFAVFLFLYVFYSYKDPDFMIQSWGVFILIIAIFFIPNKIRYMVLVSITTVVSFLVCSYFFLDHINTMQFIAGAIYLGVEIMFCAMFVYYFKHYKRGEFIAKAELVNIYSTDPLTKIGNRNKLEEEAGKWIEFCIRREVDLSLVLIDIDNMKQVNDQHGHLIGDKILYDVSQLMKSELRSNDVCVRWGGDEFVLLLPDTNISQARILLERIRKRILEHRIKDLKVNVTCSFGITSMDAKGQSLEDLIQQADASMYMAKSEGKNKIV